MLLQAARDWGASAEARPPPAAVTATAHRGKRGPAADRSPRAGRGRQRRRLHKICVGPGPCCMPPRATRSARGRSPARPRASSRAACHTPPACASPMPDAPPPAHAAGTAAADAEPAAGPGAQTAVGIDVTALQPVGKAASMVGRASAFLSALLLSQPVWCCIFICGPHMPNLFVPTLLAAALRLGMVFCNLVHQALEDGLLEPWEFFCILFRFFCDVLVTAYAVFPQPVFTTVVGGSFSGGDAARAGHMRASRWLWRLTVGFPALEMLLPLAVLCYFCVKSKLFRDRARAMRERLTFGTTRVPSWLQTMMWGAVGSMFYTAFAARMKMLPLAYLLGSDVSASLAWWIPDWSLMFRRELSLYHCIKPGWPCSSSWVTAVIISVGDGLMSNPGVPGVGGFAGSVLFLFGMWLAGQPLMR